MACTCGKCQECDWARSHPSEDAALRQTDSAEQTTADRRKLMRDRHIILKRERDLDVMDHAAMEQNLTPTEISNPFKTGTRVFWFTNERSKRVFHAGTVTGYEYVDMPWKLYVIAEDKTGRTALLHPERLGGKLKDMRMSRGFPVKGK